MRIMGRGGPLVPARSRMFSYSGYAHSEQMEIAMPIVEAFGPSGHHSSIQVLPTTAMSPAARRHGVLPMPSLEWNEQVARETEHLYARVQKVIPRVEWPFFAPYVKAINGLKKERNAVILAHN